MSPTKPLFALTAALGLLGFAGAAFAQTTQTCHTDGDCQHGYICPAVVPNGPTTPACPPDGDCSATGTGGTPARHEASGTPVPTGGTGTVPISGAGGNSGIETPAADGGTAAPGATSDPATGSPASICQPGPCAVDSDCAAGMVCHGETYTTCSGSGATPPCQAGTKCDTSGAVTDSMCTNQTVSTCTFKWTLPCSADSDCGDGFACQPSLTISCSGEANGGTGSGAGAASGASDLVADSCTTSMNFPGACHPIAVTCDSDADCPSDWICQDNTTVISSPGTGGIAGAGGATMAPSGNEGSPVSGSGSGVSAAAVASDPTTVAPPTFSRSCVAPYSSVTPTQGAGGRSGSAPSSNPPDKDGTPPTGTGTTNSTGGTTGAQQPTASGTGGTTGATTVNGAVDMKTYNADNSGGCSVSSTGGSSGAGLLAGLGLGIATLVGRRRRSR